MDENNKECKTKLNPQSGFAAIFLCSLNMLLFAYFEKEGTSPFLFEAFCVFLPSVIVILFRGGFQKIFFPLLAEKEKIKFSFIFFIFSFAFGYSSANLIDKIYDLREIMGEYDKTILQYDFFYQILLFSLVPAVFEEILFRGVILNSFLRYGKGFSFIITSILFTVFHGFLKLFIPIYIMSAFLTIIGFYRGGLFLAIIFHFLFNSLNLITINYLKLEFNFLAVSTILIVSAPLYLFFVVKGFRDVQEKI